MLPKGGLPTHPFPSLAVRLQKRGLDIAGATVGLLLLLPLFVIIAIAIKLDSRGPVFFRQERVGQNGRPFRIFKFRSMAVGAAAAGPALTLHADQRVTRLGRFLRQNKLDELPQLINVLMGQMSLVGPRPEVPEYMKFYSPAQRALILSMRPGMTDYAAILFRNESALLGQGADAVDIYRRRIMPMKFTLYERYSREISVLNDLRIILATILLLVLGRVPSWLRLEETRPLSSPAA